MAQIKTRTKEERERIEAARGPFSSREDGLAHNPEADGYKLLPVFDPAGQTVWTWAVTEDRALLTVVKHAGWKAGSGRVPNLDKVQEQFHRLSPEDQKALVAAWTTAADDKSTKGKGKGGK